MKKLLILMAIATATSGTVLTAQADSSDKLFSVDGSVGLSFGLFDSLTDTAFGDLSGLATLASIRGGGDLDLLFKINSTVSAGGSLGLYYLSGEINGSAYTLLDFPIRAVAKIGSKGAFIQPFVGYYATPVGFPFPGLELGARGALGNFYIEGGYVLGTYKWTHISIGAAFENIFSF